MRDFNFFEPYLTRGKPQSNAAIPFKLLIILLAFILAAWPLFNLGYGIWLKNEAATIKAEVMNDADYPLLSEVDNQTQALGQLQAQLTNIENADKTLKENQWLDEPFFFSLLSTVPKDVQIESVSIAMDKSIGMSGIALSKPAIAELEYNIRKADRFDSLCVTSISNDEGAYSFDMTFTLKDGED
ncbi:MAG: PilN domain-containing protein [Oscillospiraceae bacterium]